MAGPSSKPKRKPIDKGEPPKLEDTAAGIETTSKAGRGSAGGKQLLLQLDPELHREFKTYASSNDIKMKELFEKMFNFYKTHHG
ncbi:hypothetical protein C3Z09_22195 [Lelliottia aquatilis]|uniref:hypothetical protein n=1 Tax=Lelliottia aquatilis TaxID=2080838 RepID=UPI000CDEFBA6|nr:hypothetical protein [Lelliottia aquatilis]NTZ48361.1 hypothetical protein [Lelliottia aquatilis]POZ13653.1 hypothetical protein C3Z09_22195 [Lelliottia aquatilis]